MALNCSANISTRPISEVLISVTFSWHASRICEHYKVLAFRCDMGQRVCINSIPVSWNYYLNFDCYFSKAAKELGLEAGKTVKLETNNQLGHFLRVTRKVCCFHGNTSEICWNLAEKRQFCTRLKKKLTRRDFSPTSLYSMDFQDLLKVLFIGSVSQ